MYQYKDPCRTGGRAPGEGGGGNGRAGGAGKAVGETVYGTVAGSVVGGGVGVTVGEGQHAGGRERTQQPYTTGTSVVALKYAGGVMVAADTLLSYGSMLKAKEVTRVAAVGKDANMLLAYSGDHSDYQAVLDMVKRLSKEDFQEDDGSSLTAGELHEWLSRVMYNRRNKMDPLWNTLVVAGRCDGGAPFLGVTDSIGTHYQEDFIATGFGNYLAIPLLRNEWRADLSEAEARRLVEKCMMVLYYRDKQSINKITVATVDADGARVGEPYAVSTQWELDLYLNPTKNSVGNW